jgi:hypothetical protein
MGWRVGYREKDNKYRLWSTISDTWLTDWSPKKDIQRDIAQQYLWEYKKKVVEMYLDFPHHWPSSEGARLMVDEEAGKRYRDWLEELINAGDRYYDVLDKRFNEVMKELESS